ncbi:MAG: acetate--CoA ligase family protein [Pseudomonadota bacterium]
MTTLHDLIRPRSIAVIGASDNPARIGGRPVSHLIQQGFEGDIYPVNPNRDTIQGLRAYPSLTDIDGHVDFALVSVPAVSVPDVVRQARDKGVKTALIFSSGFAEMGGAGVALQDEIVSIVRDSDMRVIGPNCLGAFCTDLNFYPTFTSTIDRATPKPGGLAIISQSGAYGSHIYIACHMRRLGIGTWITTGNECDVHVAEVIKLFAEDDSVDTIVAYVESIKHGPTLIDALETARANRKPVIVMKVGRSAVGAEAAGSHTAAMVGEDSVYDAVLRHHGAYRARSTEEMIDIACACRPKIYPVGKRVGLITISGGAGVLMADAAADYGLDVARMPDDAQAELRAIVPFCAPRNPVDVTAQFFNDLSLVPRFCKVLIERGRYDGLIGLWTTVAGSPTLAEPLIQSLIDVRSGRDDLLFIQSIVAPEEVQARYEDAGFPSFEDPTRAVAAMAALMSIGTAFAQGAPFVPDLPDLAPLPAGPLSERQAKEQLAAFGIPVLLDALATSAEAAAEIAGRETGPFALKIASPDIAHKTDVGGVRLSVDGDDVAGGFDEMTAAVSKAAPHARIDGVLVAPMVSDGLDCILGAKIDPVFGPVVAFGLGGILTEVLNDVALRPAPVSVATAREMIGELRAVKAFTHPRAGDPIDLDMLADVISRFSVFAAVHGADVESIDVNPLRVWSDRCLALDALIVRTGAGG